MRDKLRRINSLYPTRQEFHDNLMRIFGAGEGDVRVEYEVVCGDDVYRATDREDVVRMFEWMVNESKNPKMSNWGKPVYIYRQPGSIEVKMYPGQS